VVGGDASTVSEPSEGSAGRMGGGMGHTDRGWQVSATVLGIASLVEPWVDYRGDVKPYFSTYDEDYAWVTRLCQTTEGEGGCVRGLPACLPARLPAPGGLTD
jgi:hypothetical protein